MFINVKALKKLMKEAYKTFGITVERHNGGLMIASFSWGVWLENSELTNEIKAAVIEYTGEMPEKGTAFTVSKRDEGRVDITEPKYSHIYEEIKRKYKQHFAGNGMDIEVGKLKYAYDSRCYNVLYGSENAYLINENYMDLVVEAEAPAPIRISQRIIGWCDFKCIVFACVLDDDKEVLKKLYQCGL
jgi:hypothetical protein